MPWANRTVIYTKIILLIHCAFAIFNKLPTKNEKLWANSQRTLLSVDGFYILSLVCLFKFLQLGGINKLHTKIRLKFEWRDLCLSTKYRINMEILFCLLSDRLRTLKIKKYISFFTVLCQRITELPNLMFDHHDSELNI